MNPSYFDVNYRVLLVLTHCHIIFEESHDYPSLGYPMALWQPCLVSWLSRSFPEAV